MSKKKKKKVQPHQTKSKTIKCRQCGKQVSKNAKRCPNCGTMLKLSTAGLIFLIVFFGVIIISAIMLLTGH